METNNVSMPLLGDRFPEIEAVTTHGTKVIPNDYAGKWIVLFSHPGDFTPVCTTEFVAFSERADDFKTLNTELVGLSVDQVFSHIKWVDWINDNTHVKVPFPVIADEQGMIAKKLGMLHKAKGTNTVRAVFIIDDKGILRLVMYYPQEVGRSVDEILRSIKALQMNDRTGYAAPENFPNNSWLGSKVIIEPAKTEQDAAERKAAGERGELEYKDWWFCFKELDK